MAAQFDLGSGAAPRTNSPQSTVRPSPCASNGLCCCSPPGCPAYCGGGDCGANDSPGAVSSDDGGGALLRVNSSLQSSQTAACSCDCTCVRTEAAPCPGPPSAASVAGLDSGTFPGCPRPPDADRCQRSNRIVYSLRQSCQSRPSAAPGAVAPTGPVDVSGSRAFARAATACGGPFLISAGTFPWRASGDASPTPGRCSFGCCGGGRGGGGGGDGSSYSFYSSSSHSRDVVDCGGFDAEKKTFL